MQLSLVHFGASIYLGLFFNCSALIRNIHYIWQEKYTIIYIFQVSVPFFSQLNSKTANSNPLMYRLFCTTNALFQHGALHRPTSQPHPLQGWTVPSQCNIQFPLRQLFCGTWLFFVVEAWLLKWWNVPWLVKTKLPLDFWVTQTVIPLPAACSVIPQVFLSCSLLLACSLSFFLPPRQKQKNSTLSSKRKRSSLFFLIKSLSHDLYKQLTEAFH